MSGSSQYVDGTSVRVRLLAGTIIGGIAIAIWEGYLRLVTEVMSWGERLLTSPIDAITELLMLALSIPTDAIEAAWQSSTAFLTGPLSVLGPFVFPIAILITMLTIWLGDQALDRMGVI